ncbi:nuclear pore complex protein Nup98-Nup96-like isoform X5 [Ciona intestinalis]
MHVHDDRYRETLVKNLISRHVTSIPTNEMALNKEKYVVDVLGVPVVWLHESRALYLKYSLEYEDCALSLIEGGVWGPGPAMFMEYVVADWLVHGKLPDIQNVLKRVDTHGRTQVADWSNGGKIFLDYVTMQYKVKRLQELLQIDASQWELSTIFEDALQDVTTLSREISKLNPRNSMHCLAQSEMAKQTMNFHRLITATMQQDDGPMFEHQMEPKLPEVYAMQELKEISDKYFQQLLF